MTLRSASGYQWSDRSLKIAKWKDSVDHDGKGVLIIFLAWIKVTRHMFMLGFGARACVTYSNKFISHFFSPNRWLRGRSRSISESKHVSEELELFPRSHVLTHTIMYILIMYVIFLPIMIDGKRNTYKTLTCSCSILGYLNLEHVFKQTLLHVRAWKYRLRCVIFHIWWLDKIAHLNEIANLQNPYFLIAESVLAIDGKN